jgi:hypothetical protein
MPTFAGMAKTHSFVTTGPCGGRPVRSQEGEDRIDISHLKRFLQDLCRKMGGIDAVRAITGHEREGNCARRQHRGDGIDRDAAQIYVEKREIERTAAGSHDGIVIRSPRRRAREWIAG